MQICIHHCAPFYPRGGCNVVMSAPSRDDELKLNQKEDQENQAQHPAVMAFLVWLVFPSSYGSANCKSISSISI